MLIVNKTKQIIILNFNDIQVGNFFILHNILYLKTNKTSAFDFHNNVEHEIKPYENCVAKTMNIIIHDWEE